MIARNSVLTYFFVTAILGSHDTCAKADDLSKFKITTKRSDDKVEINSLDDKTVFLIRSPFGISNATIERIEVQWPRHVVLRLHFKGLENFRITAGKASLHASVSSHDKNSRARLWKDGNENSPLDDKSPLWMALRMIGSDGKPSNEIPLKNGYFEMELPRALFEENPTSMTIHWIDFYR